MSAGSNCRALAFCFCVQICHILPISKYTGESDLSLCTTLVLQTKMPPHMGKFRQMLLRHFFYRKSQLRSGILFANMHRPLQICTDLDPTLLYDLILETSCKFVWENEMLVLGVCFPQTCASTGRMFAVSKSCLDYYRRIVSFPQKSIRRNACELESIENPRSFEKYPTPP